jgi:V-type H+-transporting ATPase subunit F
LASFSSTSTYVTKGGHHIEVAEADVQTQIAERIRHRIDSYTAAFPSVLEIPSKDHPYDPDKDSVLRRVRRLFGE